MPLRRTAILTKSRVNKSKLRRYLEGEGAHVEAIEDDEYELQHCHLCGRLILHPVVVNGRIYGGVCAVKMESTLDKTKVIW